MGQQQGGVGNGLQSYATSVCQETHYRISTSGHMYMWNKNGTMKGIQAINTYIAHNNMPSHYIQTGPPGGDRYYDIDKWANLYADNDGNIYLVLSGQVWINGEQPSQPNIAKWTADSSGNLVGLTENLFSADKFENSSGTDWDYLKGKSTRDINFDSENNIWFASWNGTEQQYLSNMNKTQIHLQNIGISQESIQIIDRCCSIRLGYII